MRNFSYSRPTSLQAAIREVGGKEEAKLLAGGMSLIPIMKYGLAQPERLVDLKEIPDLRSIEVDNQTVSIGAMTVHERVAESPEVAKAIPALSALAGGIGDVQVRSRGTIGGSIAHNDPAACYPAAVLGLQTSIETTARSIPGDAFFTGTMETALKPAEIIRRVVFRIPQVAAYQKFANLASRFSIVGVFLSRQEADVRVAVTGAGSRVFRVARFEAALADDFAPGALEGIEVPSEVLLTDLHGSAEYRAHLIGVLAQRAVAQCLAKAGA